MTIQSFKVMNKGPIKLRADGSRHARIDYLVTSDDVNENQNNILAHASCPERHVDGHPDNSEIICRELEVDEYEGNDLKWIVTADFDSRVNFQQIEYNATESIVEGGLEGITEDIPTFWDYDGNPLINAAEDYYEGLTKKHRLIACPVTSYFTSVPWALFSELNGTCNANSVTIHGVTFPAGFCMLERPIMSKTPTTINGQNYWPVSYRIVINPHGWVSILPNRGFYAFHYQTRTSTSAPWINAGYDAYTAETDGALKQRVKLKITEEGEADVPSNMWLNDHGEKVLADFEGIDTTVTTTAGSAVVSVTGAQQIGSEHKGKYLVIDGAGYQGRRMRAKITAASGSSATLSAAAQTQVTDAAAKAGGVWCNVYQIEELADWTNLPLPNNHT